MKKQKNAQLVLPREEWPYEVPENWVWTTIASIFDVTSSKRVHKDDWLTEGVPFYRTRELVQLSNYGVVDNDLFISREMYIAFKRDFGVPQIGDLLISGVGTIGVPFEIKSNEEFYFKDGNVVWFKKAKNINSRYIYFLYKSEFLTNQLHDMSGGTTVDTYTIINAKKTKIPLPPLPEQQRIVTRIESLFAKLDAAAEKLRRICVGNDVRISQCVGEIDLVKKSILARAFRGLLGTNDPKEESAEGWLNGQNN